MKVKIYCSYGVLAHEKRNFYSYFAPASSIYDTLEVEIPDNLIYGMNYLDEPILTLNGMRYPLQKVLTNAGDDPVIRWYDGHHYHTIPLKEGGSL